MPRSWSWRRRSCDEAPLSERPEDHILEGPLGIRTNVADVVASAEMLELRCMRLPCGDVCGGELRRDFELAHGAGFRVDELDVAERPGIPVAFGNDVHHEYIVPEGPQDFETGVEPARVEEVGDDDRQPELPRTRRKLLERLTQ